jgi:transposase
MPERIVIHKRSKYPAVYFTLRSYRDEAGKPTHERVCIGKKDPNTGKLIPNHRYFEVVNPNPSLEIVQGKGSNRSVGASFLISSILKDLGVAEALTECLGLKRASRLQTAATYMVARGNVFEDVDKFCLTSTYLETPITSQIVSQLFASITFDERMDFFKNWIARRNLGPCSTYDVTSISTYGKEIANKAFGYNRDGESLEQVNLGCYLSESSGLPIFYTVYNGAIVDKSQLPHMLAFNKELGITDVGFILDRGFCSTANIRHMAGEGLTFIIGVEKRHKTTRVAIDFARKIIHLMDNRTKCQDGIYAISADGHYYGTDCTMHVYYDPKMAEDQRTILDQKLTKKEELFANLKEFSSSDKKFLKDHFNIIKYAEDGKLILERDFKKINDKTKDFGFYCLLTNTKLDKSEVLEIYRRRDVIEKGYDDVKNYVHMKRLKTHNDETTDGKLFCSFIALIVTLQIGVKLKNYMKEHSMSKNSVIKELETIRVHKSISGKRIMDALTKTQREIYNAFGLTKEDLEAYIISA